MAFIHRATLLQTLTVACFILLAACETQENTDPTIKPETTAKPALQMDFEPRAEAAHKDPANWLLRGRSYKGHHHSLLAQITTQNVDQLGLSWYQDYPNEGGQESTPLVVDGVLYTSTAWSVVYAYDAATGRELWHYNPLIDRKVLVRACCGPVNRGVAYWQGKIFVGTLDGRLEAIDAKTGKPLWSVNTIGNNEKYTITGAPLVANGKVFIGNGGAEYGVRGFVTAYDANTGDQVWRFYTVPGNPNEPFENPVLEQAAKTWHGEWWKLGGGGTVWDGLAFDPDTNLFYIGVGNSGPYDPMVRTAGKGDNLFVSSIVAVDADTGKYVWHYQTTPGDSWDYTATQNMILADLELNGETRKVIMQAPKNGFFYVLDRVTGEFLSAEAYETVTWAKGIDKNGRPIVNEDAKYWKNGKALVFPSPIGAHSWPPMAYSPDSGLVYIPANHIPQTLASEKQFEYREKGFNTAMSMNNGQLPNDPAVLKEIRKMISGKLLAWNPKTQSEAWSVPYDQAANGGILSTAGNLVFQGSNSGSINAYNAKTGAALWHFDAQTSVIAPPISYQVNGQQYVAVMVGKGGVFARIGAKLDNPNTVNRSRLLVFSLNGDQQLPPLTDLSLDLPDFENITVSPRLVKQGQAIYSDYCAVCHGIDAVGGSTVPDLRYSGYAANKKAFDKVMIEGALSRLGMVAFNDVLNEQEIEALRHYIVHENQRSRAANDIQRQGR